MSKMSQILEGWGRHIAYAWFNIYNEERKQIMETRLEICDTCSIRTERLCDETKLETHPITGELERGCGCSIQAKAFVMENNVCPLAKWPEINL